MRFLTHVVVCYILFHPLEAVRIQVVCQNGTTPFSSRNCEWANASEDVRNDSILGFEKLHESLMLGMQPRIPVYLPEVKRESTIGLVLSMDAQSISRIPTHNEFHTHVLHDEIRLSGNKLHIKEPELIMNVVEFVDDCSDLLVFLIKGSDVQAATIWERSYIHNNLADDIFKRKIFVS